MTGLAADFSYGERLVSDANQFGYPESPPTARPSLMLALATPAWSPVRVVAGGVPSTPPRQGASGKGRIEIQHLSGEAVRSRAA
jgi:hypothetical protein